MKVIFLNMTKTKRAKYLYKFLKSHNCLQKYVLYTKSHNSSCGVLIPNNIEIIGFLKLYNNIGGAFPWINTKEGDEYWRNLDYKFENLMWKYEEINYVNNL